MCTSYCRSTLRPWIKRMQQVFLREKEEFIRLGQALKKSGIMGSGADAKMVINDGAVSVNGEVELRRGRKLYAGVTVTYEGETFQIAT